MADMVTNGKTSLSAEEVIVRAVQFFTTSKWKPTTQSARTATFSGRPPIPWFMILLTILGFFCIVPGIIMYVLVIKKFLMFVNLVVTANPIPKDKGTEVVITHHRIADKLANSFLSSLPPLESSTKALPQDKTTPLPQSKTRPLPQEKIAPLPREKSAPLPQSKTRPQPQEKTAPLPREKTTPPRRDKDSRNYKFCTQCGTKNDAGNEFCDECGTKFS